MPDKLKHSTRGANQNHNRRSDGKSRPSRRPISPFRPQNPPHADFSFRPTDFPVQGYRLFGDPYRLFLLRLRGHSDESYGTRFARFPNFCRFDLLKLAKSDSVFVSLRREEFYAAFATAPDDVPNKFIDEYFKHKNVTEFQSREMFAIDFTNAAKLCGQAEDETPPF